MHPKEDYSPYRDNVCEILSKNKVNSILYLVNTDRIFIFIQYSWLKC